MDEDIKIPILIGSSLIIIGILGFFLSIQDLDRFLNFDIFPSNLEPLPTIFILVGVLGLVGILFKMEILQIA